MNSSMEVTGLLLSPVLDGANGVGPRAWVSDDAVVGTSGGEGAIRRFWNMDSSSESIFS